MTKAFWLFYGKFDTMTWQNMTEFDVSYFSVALQNHSFVHARLASCTCFGRSIVSFFCRKVYGPSTALNCALPFSSVVERTYFSFFELKFASLASRQVFLAFSVLLQWDKQSDCGTCDVDLSRLVGDSLEFKIRKKFSFWDWQKWLTSMSS